MVQDFILQQYDLQLQPEPTLRGLQGFVGQTKDYVRHDLSNNAHIVSVGFRVCGFLWV